MNQHEHRHTAKGTRDDVETNARRKEHFLRLLVTAGAELLARSDDSFARQVADGDHVIVGQTVVRRHGDKPAIAPSVGKLKDVDRPRSTGGRRVWIKRV